MVMKKILFLLLLIFGNLSFSEYVKEGTYNGANDKKFILDIIHIVIMMNF